MKKIEVWIIIVALILIAMIIAARKTGNSSVEVSKVCFSEKCFEVEIADTPSERERGLMNREDLGENSGMFFIFDSEGEYSFWMKNTLIPLDLIWISENLEVVDVKTAEPCAPEFCDIYTPKGSAKYVLEINAGEAERFGITTGEKIRIK